MCGHGLNRSGSVYGLNISGSIYGLNLSGSMYGLNLSGSIYGLIWSGSMFGLNRSGSIYVLNLSDSMYGLNLSSSIYGLNRSGSMYGLNLSGWMYGLNLFGWVYGLNWSGSVFGLNRCGSLFGLNRSNSMYGPMAGCWEYDDETLGSLKGEAFPNEPKDSQLCQHSDIHTQTAGNPTATASGRCSARLGDKNCFLRAMCVVTVVDSLTDQGFAIAIVMMWKARNTLHLTFKLHGAETFLRS